MAALPGEHHFFERELELRYLKSRGAAFQDLFSDVMEKAYPQDFQRIRPHGNTGDLKCDGYLVSQRTVFQLYGPDEIRSLSRLLTKIREDFVGAKQHWTGRMDCWAFVHNSQAGLPAQAVQLLDDLAHEPNAPRVETWGHEQLRQVLHRIAPNALRSLFPGSSSQGQPSWRQLPQPAATEQYWDWLRSNLQATVQVPYLTVLQDVDLDIKLIPPEVARERHAAEERATARHTTNAALTAEHVAADITLFQALKLHRHLLIVGDSGSGKTTSLRRFAKHEVRFLRRFGTDRNNRQTPVIVELWRFGPTRFLIDLIVSSVNRSGANIPQEDLLTAVARGYVAILLDGLDEVTAEHRRECLAQIAGFVSDYPRAWLVVTSRPFPEPPSYLHHFALAHLTDQDISAAMYAQIVAHPNSRLGFPTYLNKESLYTGLRHEIRHLCRRPLILGLVLNLLVNEGELPSTLYGIYDRFLSVLLDWEVRKERIPSASTAMAVLEEVAYAMESQEQKRLSNVEWGRIVGQVMYKLRSKGMTSGTSGEQILQALLSTGLIQDFGGEVSFSHRSFLEFLAARRLAHNKETAHIDPVALHLGVACFLCGTLKSVAPLLEEHLRHCNDVQELMPLLDEASQSNCDGGRFEGIYSAIVTSQEIGIDIDFLRDQEEETFFRVVDDLVRVCLDFGPEAISILKDAAHGVINTTKWENSRLWFERIVEGLEVYGWPGAALHRQFAEAGVFEKIGLFSDDGFDPKATNRLKVFYDYLDATNKNDFSEASKQLTKLKRFLITSRNRSRPRKPRKIKGQTSLDLS